MPIQPFGAEQIILTKSPSEGNKPRFSNGKSTISINAWDVKNSRVKTKNTAYTKVYNDETRLSIRTYDPIALELETDDMATWEDKPYRVQAVQGFDIPLGLNKKVYEISLR